mmetsp:Transcript_30549/g.89290  ORF Transcript_30549/g.89290 Transcript_30549/m.89290 type:complete len:215 (-) Transcript_30549:437-1081(-)
MAACTMLIFFRRSTLPDMLGIDESSVPLSLEFLTMVCLFHTKQMDTPGPCSIFEAMRYQCGAPMGRICSMSTIRLSGRPSIPVRRQHRRFFYTRTLHVALGMPRQIGNTHIFRRMKCLVWPKATSYQRLLCKRWNNRMWGRTLNGSIDSRKSGRWQLKPLMQPRWNRKSRIERTCCRSSLNQWFLSLVCLKQRSLRVPTERRRQAARGRGAKPK